MKRQVVLLAGSVIFIIGILGGIAFYWLQTSSIQTITSSLSNRIAVVTDVQDVLHRTPYGEEFLDPHAAEIRISGESWRGVTEIYQRDDPIVHLIALTATGSRLDVTCPRATDTVGVQFWGDENDGWAKVTVDNEYEWLGNTWNNQDYVEITNLSFGEHTIRIEALGEPGKTDGDIHVTLAGISCQQQGPGMTATQRVFLPLIFN